MITSFVVNAFVAFGFMICLLFLMGDPTTALKFTTGWPIIEICYQAARQLFGSNALMSMIIIPRYCLLLQQHGFGVPSHLGVWYVASSAELSL